MRAMSAPVVEEKPKKTRAKKVVEPKEGETTEG